jgi:hypothetical protein
MYAGDYNERLVLKWADAATVRPIVKNKRPSGTFIAPRDVSWIQARTSASISP